MGRTKQTLVYTHASCHCTLARFPACLGVWRCTVGNDTKQWVRWGKASSALCVCKTQGFPLDALTRQWQRNWVKFLFFSFLRNRSLLSKLFNSRLQNPIHSMVFVDWKKKKFGWSCKCVLFLHLNMQWPVISKRYQTLVASAYIERKFVFPMHLHKNAVFISRSSWQHSVEWQQQSKLQ